MANAIQEHVQELSDTEASGTMQLVSFLLENETFAVEITKVREIILICEITAIPESPSYVKGVINLRSSVIPVIDLRGLLGLTETDLTTESRIIVVRVESRMIGVIVDGVDEVLRISKSEIAPPPPTIVGLGQDYLTGLIRLEERLLILLDLDKVLDVETGIETGRS